MACVTIAASGHAGPAAAQERPAPRAAPYALFGSGGGRTHALDVTFSAAGAYEVNDSDRGDAEPVSIFESSGAYETLDAAVAYTWNTRRLTFSATAGAGGRYYNEERKLYRVSERIGAGISADLGGRMRVFGNQSVNCSPLHFQGLFLSLDPLAPGAVGPSGVNATLDDLRACAYTTTGSLGYSLSTRSSIEASGSTTYTDFDLSAGDRSLRSYSVGARFQHNLTRNASVRAGYVRRVGEFGLSASGRRLTAHDLDIGVDYGRALSLSRRTQIDFGVGSMLVEQPVGEAQHRWSYRVTGSAGLNHEIGRTWRARGAYFRGVGFVHGLGGPVFTDGVSASLDGLIGRRVDVTILAGLVFGEVDVADSDIRTSTGSARLRYALSRSIATYAEYAYYDSRFGGGQGLFLEVPRSISRHAVSAGLTLWVPVVRR